MTTTTPIPLTLEQILAIPVVKGSVDCEIYQEIARYDNKVLKYVGEGFFIGEEKWSLEVFNRFRKELEVTGKLHIYPLGYLGDRIVKETGEIFTK